MNNIIKKELYTNKTYIYLSILISILTILPQFVFSPSIEHSIYLIITFVLLVILPKFSKILFSIFIIFINLSNIIIGHISLHWGYNVADISPRIEVAVLSPTSESTEYISTYISYMDFSIILYVGLNLFLLYKFLMHSKHSFKVIKIIALGVFTSIIIAISFYKNPIKNIEPFSIPDKIIRIVKNKEFEQHTLERSNNLSKIKIKIVDKKNLIYDKVIVVMGESVNKHHMSIYDYKIKTTPFLASLKKLDKLYIFNAIAPSNQTMYSVPINLTKANVHNYLDLYLHSYSILSEFKVNNYTTYWISNQARVGKYDSITSAMANEANIQIFANSKHSDAKTDDVVLDYLDKFHKKQTKEMYLVHLMGSHSSYNKRYTEDLSIFKKAQNIDEEYDNSIYYTDYILSQIYNKFKDEKLLLIYLSDHGEIINSQRHGHGFLPAYKDEYDVPFVIYSSIKNPRLDELYKENKKGYFNLENFNYITNYISGISDENNISYSSNIFALEPKNIFNYNNIEFYK